MTPRPTMAILKLAEPTSEKLHTLIDDEDISTAFKMWAYTLLKRLGIPHPIRDEVEEQLGPDRSFSIKGTPASEDELNLNLLDVIKAKRPDCYHIIGVHIPFFRHWQVSLLARTATDETSKQALSALLEQNRLPSYELEHFPDNPISVDRDPVTRKHTLTDVEDAELKHFAEIMAYFRSLRPAGVPGRPKGRTKPRRSGRQTIDPREAQAIYQATLDGLDWKQIARKVVQRSIPTDSKARERLRQWIRARQAKGLRLSRDRKK